MRICFVVQRYGEEVNGGAEAYARQVAEHMVSLGGHDVSCATTKAIDYVTWKNEYPNDEDTLNGVKIYRFPTIAERNSEKFNKLCGKVLTTKTSISEQEKWMTMQGPNSPALVEWVEKHADDYDCFIFVCYLYYSTYFALPKVASKAVFIPTAHEEAPIHLDIFENMFKLPAAFYYNTEEEKELTNKLFPSSIYKPDNNGRGGVGVEIPEGVDAKAFKAKYNLDNFILYVGRIDENKCCPELFRYFEEYKKRNPESNLKLVLMGKEIVKIPKRDDIVSLGFVEEWDKFSGMAAAEFFILPSKYESLSIVVLESMSLGKPVLVNGGCDVLRGHCTKSNGGLYYTNYYEFEGCVNYMLSHKDEMKVMGENGIKYIENNYTWSEIIKGYEELIARIL